MNDSVSEMAGGVSDLRRARRNGDAHPPSERPDRLPPHDDKAEQGVLGCILLAPNECLPGCRNKFGDDEVFYDLRHQLIWHALVFLHSRSEGIDIITLQTELNNRQQLDQVGGIPYLNALQDGVPSAANLSYYLEIVWEKYVWRRLVHKNTDQIGTVYEWNGAAESYAAHVDQEHQAWKSLLDRGQLTPKNLCAPAQFGEEYYQQWFNRHDDTYGFELPFKFPLRLRPKATTLMTGDNGSGKTSMLCHIAVCIANQLDVAAGEKLVLASMEMPPEVTLWIMARQLLGLGAKQQDDEPTRKKLVKALAWLNARVRLYNFLGITDHHELLNTFQYAAEHEHGKFFILDNMSKVGIADDDYAAQGLFMHAVCDFNIKRAAHTVVVVHENKGDGPAKYKVRGSKQLTDAPDNVVGMKRNEDKGAKLEELKAREKAIDDTSRSAADQRAEISSERNKLFNVWDAKFVLSKQRWPGSQQNGSRWLYFDRQSLQFHEHPGQPAHDYTLD